MTHAELQQQVVQLLGLMGWSHLHVRKSIGKGTKWTTTTNIIGWPDLAPCWSVRQPGRTIAIEIKVPRTTCPTIRSRASRHCARQDGSAMRSAPTTSMN